MRLPEEYLAQIRGKTVAEQLDYLAIATRDPLQKCLVREQGSLYYDSELSLRHDGVLLRYSDLVSEVLVNDQCIVAVRCRAVWKYAPRREAGSAARLVEHVVDCVLTPDRPSEKDGLWLVPVIYAKSNQNI